MPKKAIVRLTEYATQLLERDIPTLVESRAGHNDSETWKPVIGSQLI
jgi:hypothetical protein